MRRRQLLIPAVLATALTTVIVVVSWLSLPKWRAEIGATTDSTLSSAVGEKSKLKSHAEASRSPLPSKSLRSESPRGQQPLWRATIDPGIMAVALSGWLVAIALFAIFFQMTRKWRTAFSNQTWMLVPSAEATRLGDGLVALDRHTGVALQDLSSRVSAAGEALSHSLTAIAETRAEFKLLRDELDDKARELAALKLGHEFHMRRPVLLSIIRALDIIDGDRANARDMHGTLDGVRVELWECLEDNAVSVVSPEPGTRLSEARAVDAQVVVRVPAPEEDLKGTIVSVDRPAYVFRGPRGAEDALLLARVQVYV